MGGRGRRARKVIAELSEAGELLWQVEVQNEQPYIMPLQPEAVPTEGYLVVGSAWDGEKTPYYPLFPQDRAWQLLARDGRTLDEHPVLEQHRFGMEKPTLAWQNGTNRIELYVDGMGHEAFMREYGLQFDVTKNGFVTSKRMSRTLRDYRVSDRLPESDITVEYLDLDQDGEDIWDGAGLISRSMVERLQLSPHMSEPAQERLRAELAHIGRVEVTLVNSAGQHKCHAIVVDDMDVDFKFPNDIKRDSRTTDGTAFIGINPVHSKDAMRLDVQSIMNLHPFVDASQMLDYLEEEGELFRDAIETGKKGQAMARLERATQDDLEAWPMRDFFARGGDANWFPGMVKGLVNGHIERLEMSLDTGKLRIPFSGGRYYVMTQDVAKEAGLDIQLERGQIHLDPTTATAWVHSEDWLHLPDSPDDNPMGIKHILGGADQDDALWLHGFTDYDGQRKMLAWRSPNNTGEYVVLQPTDTSQPMLWNSPDGDTQMYPPADSRKLIKRVDELEQEIQFLDMAQAPKPGELGQGQDYTPDLMDEVLARSMENAGTLGGYCNFTMGFKGTMGRVPKILPDRLENVIDNDVKLGGSNAQVGEEIGRMTQAFLATGTPIPDFLLPRFGVYKDADGNYPTNVTRTDGSHWVDELSNGVRAYTDDMIVYRDDKMEQARLPAVVHDSIAGDSEALRLGSRFNQVYTETLLKARKHYAKFVTANPRSEPHLHQAQRKDYNDRVFDYVRHHCEQFLDEHPKDRQTAIIRGAMVSREMNQSSSDSAFWQRGRIAQTSIQALEELGLLGEIHEEVTPNGTRLVRYPTPEQAQRQATYEPVKIQQVWFNRLLNFGFDGTMKEVESARRTQSKQEVRFLASRSAEQGGFIGQKLRVGERYFGSRLVRVFEDNMGTVFGVIHKDHAEQYQLGDEVVLRQAKGADGNIVGMVERKAST